ncbi:outer membrane beta-barrel protein [Spirosoma oryzicola]|uniref:outer membrane beta-barrel protein n=1 Tax=Spirosoma oryzicola TaxID=2898794 RepID=UPI001E5C857F|nr:outer membrane beta-barrel protein [Spirosoma oryzicola]UHG94349.1 outer membrane beta-barrel protein [Spirosoma oryzicola]
MQCAYGLLLLFCLGGQAQSINNLIVRGVVVDSVTHYPLSQATISLRSTSDTLRVTTQLADSQGRFSFLTQTSGTYWLTITYVGYGSLHQSVVLSRARPIADLGTLFIKPRAIQLREVRVQQRQPVRVRNDTLEFDAGSFSNRPNSVVEDLIRNLPGIEVASNGGVMAQGKAVQQIFVNGQPFFGSDLRMATRNLPADLIDKIQVFDKRSDQSTFTGVDDGSRSRTINIVTKPEARRGQFGQQGVGYGTDGRYLIGGGVNQFSGRRQVSLLGQANNLNQPGYSLPITSSGSGLSSGIIQSAGAGLNYSNQLGKRLDLSFSYLVDRTDNQQEQRLRRQTIQPNQAIPDSAQLSLVTTTSNQTSSRLLNHRVTMGVNFQMDSMNLIRITLAGNSYTNNTVTAMTIQTKNGQQGLNNQSVIDNRMQSTNQLLAPTVLWMHRFRRPGRTLSVNNSLSVNELTSNGLNQSVTTAYSSVSAQHSLYSVQDQQTSQHTRSTTDDLSLAYTEPFNDHHSLEIHYKLNLNQSTSNRTVFDRSPTNPTVEQRNPTLSNQTQSAFLSHGFGMGWQYHQTKYRYTLGLDMQQARLKPFNQTTSTSLSRHYLTLLPYAVFQPQLGNNRYIQLTYQTRMTAPSVTQLQPVADVTNPVFVQTGNTNLRPEYTHSVSLNYNQFQTETSRSTSAMLTAELTRHRIVLATNIDANGVQTTQPINTDGYLTLTGLLTVGQQMHLRPLIGSFGLTTQVNLNRGVTFINNQLNRSLALLAGQTVRLNTTVGPRVTVNLAGTISYQATSYSLQHNGTNQALTATLQTGISSQLPLGLRLVTDLSITTTAGRSAGYNQQYVLWNGYVTYSLFKQDAGELRLQVFDLLNQNRSLTRTVGDTYVEDGQNLAIRRYLLVSFVYNLRQFGASQLKP